MLLSLYNEFRATPVSTFANLPLMNSLRSVLFHTAHQKSHLREGVQRMAPSHSGTAYVIFHCLLNDVIVIRIRPFELQSTLKPTSELSAVEIRLPYLCCAVKPMILT